MPIDPDTNRAALAAWALSDRLDLTAGGWLRHAVADKWPGYGRAKADAAAWESRAAVLEALQLSREATS